METGTEAIDAPLRARRATSRHPFLRPETHAILGIWLLCCVLLSSTLFTTRVLGGEANLLFQVPFAAPAGLAAVNENTFDAVYVFHPDMEAARDALRSFRLPAWSAYIGGGEPLLATQQHAALYPVNLLASLLPFWHSLAWIAALKLLLAGAGTILFVRALGLRTVPALFAGIAFTFGTYLIAWIDHPHVNSYVLIPWALLAAGRLARSGHVRDALLTALVFGAGFLGGQPEAMFLLLLITLPWFALRLTRTRAVRASGLMAGALVLGLGVGAVMLLPFAELASQSFQLSRGGSSGAPRGLLWSFFMPDLWGRPDKFLIGGAPGDLPYPERTAYFGALPLLLAAGGLVARRCTREQIFFAAAGLLALGLVVRVPVYTHRVASLPLFREVNLTRALVLCCFSGAVLAAYGLQVLLDDDFRARRRLLLGAAVAAVPPLAWLAMHSYLLDRLGDSLAQLPVQAHGAAVVRDVQMAVVLRWSIVAVAGLAALAVATWRPQLRLRAVALVIAVTVLDLLTLVRGYQPAAEAAVAQPAAPAVVGHLQRTLGHGRVAGGVELGPNVAERYGLRDARLHEQPVIERRARLWQALGGEGPVQRPQLPANATRLADLFAVKYMFSVPLAQAPSAGWQPAPGPFMVERTSPHPRAWLTHGWRSASSMNSALSELTAGRASDDLRRPVIEGATGSPASVAPGRARFVEDGDRRIVLATSSASAGWLVLADTYYPGWRATVDGKPAAIHPANVAFRAVALPAGRHTVAFEYRPWSVPLGAAVSLLSILVLGGGLLLTRSRTPGAHGLDSPR